MPSYIASKLLVPIAQQQVRPMIPSTGYQGGIAVRNVGLEQVRLDKDKKKKQERKDYTQGRGSLLSRQEASRVVRH